MEAKKKKLYLAADMNWLMCHLIYNAQYIRDRKHQVFVNFMLEYINNYGWASEKR